MGAAALALGSYTDSHQESHDDAMARMKASTLQTTFTMTFEDIVGQKHIKQTMKENLLDHLKGQSIDAKKIPPTLMLLYGPPGTSKSFTARAVGAKTVGKCAFYNLTAKDLTSTWQGRSTKLIEAFFDMARSSRPCIILADEIDKLIPIQDNIRSKEEAEFVGALLLQLDNGYKDNHGIFFIAITNSQDKIDGNFLRRLGQDVSMPCNHYRVFFK